VSLDAAHHRRIAIGFAWISLFVVLGKLAGAAKEMAIAWRYGVSETVDAYVLLFTLANWPVGVWFSILTAVLVPVVVAERAQSPERLARFRRELLGLALASGVVLSGLGWIAFDHFMHSGAFGIGEVALREASRMGPPLVLLIPMGFAISLFSVWTMACGRHMNTLLEAIPALVLLAALALPPGWIPEPLVWGTLAGFALHVAGLAWPLRRSGELDPPAFSLRSPAWRGFWSGVGVMAVGQTLMSITGIVDQMFAAGMGSGALASLSYANRIVALIFGLGAMAISRATLPPFSELAGKGEQLQLSRLARRWTWLMLLLGAVGMLVAWASAPLAVGLLFERGAFSSDDTAKVSELLRHLSVQLPFYFGGLVFVTYFSALRKLHLIALSGAGNLVVKVLVLALFAPAYGIHAVIYSSVAMYAFSFVLFWWRFVAERSTENRSMSA
jgi:putative peptidoglycan lipid II flippase